MAYSPITSLRLQQFRSYPDYAVELSPGVNIVVGPNASGKTNLLESVLLVAGVGSYRAGWADVVQHGADWSRVDLVTTTDQRSLKIDLRSGTPQKTYVLHGVDKKRLPPCDVLPVVLFEPEHMRLLTGSPSLRRDFFDDMIELLVPGFATTRRHYARALAQRNRLLKSPGSVSEQLFAWNIRLSELAGAVVRERLRLLERFNGRLAQNYSDIAGEKTTVQMSYTSSVAVDTYESSMLQKLDQHIALDRDRGFTGVGPHRDDIEIRIRTLPAAVTASRGETRTLLLSIKALEIALLHELHDAPPIVLLDDVFSELDGARRGALTHYLQGVQTVITTTDADVVAKSFAQDTYLISL